MTLHVPSSLLPQAGDNREAQRFLLASTEWIDLQSRVQAMLALPSDLGEFEERYGDASAPNMKQCFHAMHKLQQTATRYGSPKRLRARILNDPRFLAKSARPVNDALSATVWTLEHAHEDASMLAAAFERIPALARSGAAGEAAAAIRHMLLGEGGIIDRMHRTIDQLNVLIGEFQAIESELDAAQLAMMAFTERASPTRAGVDKEIGALQAGVVALERTREAAYQKWLALATSACIVPGTIAIAGAMLMVTLTLPAGVASFAVGPVAAGGHTAASAALASSAAAARTAYDDLVAQLQTEGDFFANPVCFRADLGALDLLMKFSLSDSSGVIGDLVSLKHGWTGAIREFSSRANELSADNLHAGPWLDGPAMTQAAASWSLLDHAIGAFVAGSFIDAEPIDFGSVLPRDDGAWQSHFSFRKAA